MSDLLGGRIGRRQFLGAAAGASVMILKPQLVRGATTNSAVRLGLLGCGGRGLNVTSSFLEHTGAVVTAIGDLFPDRLELGKAKLDETAAKFGKPAIDPQGPTTGDSHRVARGGNWNLGASHCLASSRASYPSGTMDRGFGFRLQRTEAAQGP